ncbi:hypothetical protein [Desulfosoma caldarium]|uniref:Uncharacterized protein n=1 Tax=Desulfosoma caldarium TaxID=610254 RepID=A0A3N1UQV8_9BACT|nr:hypothetical protein [Desulfosoma caldarium]ROQ92118.1 hypothetical protein EDC27_1800 [Desulfosoma caldarium]
MAEIEWKGIIWRAAHGDLTIKDLLTILKGHGPLEVLRFRKPGAFWGELSVSLSSRGTKEITIYHLEVEGPKRRGKGRQALLSLKRIFGGEVFVEDPGRVIRVTNADQASLPFWIKMYLEGIINALESEHVSLTSESPREEAERLLREMTRNSNAIQDNAKNAGEGKSHTAKGSR